MSAPVITRGSGTRTQERPAHIPTQRRGEAADPVPAPSAAQRAYARRDDRARRLTGARPARPAAPPGRAQFVLLVMVLLGTALVATLWLSTAAAADSYRLRDARVAARTLGEQSARLQRQVAEMVSPPALAQRAMALGMVPVEDVARLVVLPDGAVEVVGEPSAAVAPPRAFPSWPSAAPSTGTAAPRESTESPESTESSEPSETESSTSAPDGSAAAAALIGVGPGSPSDEAGATDRDDSSGADEAQDAEQDGSADTDADEGTRSGRDGTDTSDSADSSDTTDSSDSTDSTDSSDTADSSETAGRADRTADRAATAGAGG